MGIASTDRTQTPEITVFSIKVEKDKLARFKKATASKQRSMAQQIRWYIDQEVREFEADGDRVA